MWQRKCCRLYASRTKLKRSTKHLKRSEQQMPSCLQGFACSLRTCPQKSSYKLSKHEHSLYTRRNMNLVLTITQRMDIREQDQHKSCKAVNIVELFKFRKQMHQDPHECTKTIPLTDPDSLSHTPCRHTFLQRCSSSQAHTLRGTATSLRHPSSPDL